MPSLSIDCYNYLLIFQEHNIKKIYILGLFTNNCVPPRITILTSFSEKEEESTTLQLIPRRETRTSGLALGLSILQCTTQDLVYQIIKLLANK